MNFDITSATAEEALRELTTTLEGKVSQRTAELRHRARQLQKLTLDMSVAEERERERMAEILHDDLQQVLAAAKFHVGLMRNRARHDVSLQATATQVDHMLKEAIDKPQLAAEVDHMLKEAIDKSRSLSHELSPAVMHHADFAATLRWLANDRPSTAWWFTCTRTAQSDRSRRPSKRSCSGRSRSCCSTWSSTRGSMRPESGCGGSADASACPSPTAVAALTRKRWERRPATGS